MNAGPDPAQNVVASDTLPGGVAFVSTSGCAEDPNGVPDCILGTIAANSSKQYTITVTVNSGTPDGTLTNSVSVTSDTPDPNGSNDADTEDTTVASVVLCNGLTPTIVGTSGNNTITGTNGNDVIHGRGGNDVINGRNGDDIVCGGEDNDTLNGGNGKDRLFGENGNDALNGNNGDDAHDGGAGTDTCNGGNGSDTAVSCETVTSVP